MPLLLILPWPFPPPAAPEVKPISALTGFSALHRKTAQCAMTHDLAGHCWLGHGGWHLTTFGGPKKPVRSRGPTTPLLSLESYLYWTITITTFIARSGPLCKFALILWALPLDNTVWLWWASGLSLFLVANAGIQRIHIPQRILKKGSWEGNHLNVDGLVFHNSFGSWLCTSYIQ